MTNFLFVPPGTERPEDMVQFILGGERDVLCSHLCKNESKWGLIAGKLLDHVMFRHGLLHFPATVISEWGALIQEVRDRRERDLTGEAVPPCKAAEYATHNMMQRAAFAAFFEGTGTSKLGDHIAPLRNLTGSHGVRPIRVRLLEYLVIGPVWRAALAQRA
jgi:hypothetical protein